MTLPFFDQDVYGCVAPGGYGYSRGRNQSTLPRSRGRSRRVMRDIWQRVTFDILIVMNDSQFASWQTFWSGPAGYGSNAFRMRLRVDRLEIYNAGIEIYEVNAKNPWSASYSAAGLWDVKMQVSSPSFRPIVPDITCDEIYGGPLDNLATDDIYGGPLDNLATDIIEPCPGILL